MFLELVPAERHRSTSATRPLLLSLRRYGHPTILTGASQPERLQPLPRRR